MTDVPTTPIYDADDVQNALHRKELESAMRTLRRLASAKTMQRVPLERILKPLTWKQRVVIGARRFVPGFIIAAAGYLIDIVATGGVGALTGGAGVFVAAAGYGVLGGLGLTGYKITTETIKDKNLDKEVRIPETFRAEGYDRAQMDYIAHIITITMTLAEAAGFDTATALRQVYVLLDILHKLPYEVSELLTAVASVADNGANKGLTGADIQAVLNEASDVKDAYKRLWEVWNER